MIVVSKRKKKLISELNDSGYIIIDVTSKSGDATFVKFSPFYIWPDGIEGIVGGHISTTVEGLWQGLKCFENEGIDASLFDVRNIKAVRKRNASTVRGRILGHSIDGILVDYVDARKMIYVPAYTYVLEKYLGNEVRLLVGLLEEGNKIALLDYSENGDVSDVTHPLSHAQLIKAHVLANATTANATMNDLTNKVEQHEEIFGFVEKQSPADYPQNYGSSAS